MFQYSRSSNPALNEQTFRNETALVAGENVMTLQGTINKTFLLTLLVGGGALLTWNWFFDPTKAGLVMPFMVGGGVLAFIFALITAFKKSWSPITAPVYAITEGLLLGGISAFFESMYPYIAVQAIMLTLGTLFSLLFAYKSGWIKVTQNFRLGVFAATGGIGLIYLSSFILGFFGVNIPFIHENGIIGIGFSLFVVVIAALNLVLDFDFIENASEQGVPKYMEWYAAFGLMVTLVWLYIEFLRLLAKLRSRD